MADAKNPNPAEQVAALQERLATELPELSQNISAELDALKTERARFVFRSLVEGEPEAIERMAEIDSQLKLLEEKRLAVADETARVQKELSGITANITSAAAEANRLTAAKWGTSMDKLEASIRDDIYGVAQKLMELREFSAKTQNKLIESGLNEESLNYTFGGYRNSLSDWVVLCLGRMGKLNLNSSISHTASEEWRKRVGATTP